MLGSEPANESAGGAHKLWWLLALAAVSFAVLKPVAPDWLIRPPDWLVWPFADWINALFSFMRDDLGLAPLSGWRYSGSGNGRWKPCR